ncbi:MAG: VCBS repeat-containing protein [Myxococcales bacterium]|nr:VCBS repeat-containing protein [Myxococcales bacterium]
MKSWTPLAISLALGAAPLGCGGDSSGTDSDSATTNATSSVTTATTAGPTTDGSGSETASTDPAGTDSESETQATTVDSDTDPTTEDPTTETTDPTTETTDPTTETTGPMPDQCKVNDDMNGVGDCTMESPPDSFEPDVQWDWWGPNNETQSLVPALVANLTDDDMNGEIDLCDIPDIVVLATDFANSTHIYVLDGATGSVHFMIPNNLSFTITPAIGDIDSDGIPEIIAGDGAGFGGPAHILAFEHDGALKWTSTATWSHQQGGSIAIADLDNDGDVEIIAHGLLLDHNGQLLFQSPAQVTGNNAPTAADLDGDGDLEIIHGREAYHHDGSVYYVNMSVTAGFPQVADLDDDPEPEIIVNSNAGITILEHDGSIKVQNANPLGGSGFRPSTVHDFDGDEVSEFAVSTAAKYAVYEPDVTVKWSANVQDGSGWAAGTAFDFDGNGVAEAMYGDEVNLYVFDGNGQVLLSVPRSARTLTEYPIVADVDNDGSAEIVVVSDAGFQNNQTAPTVQVIRDIEDRWIQARRIWNQHTYHVTNVREDGTIPQFEPKSWENLNTFRTNSQIENGAICNPPIPE